MLSLRSWATKREEVRTGKDTGTLGMFNAAVFVSQVKNSQSAAAGRFDGWPTPSRPRRDRHRQGTRLRFQHCAFKKKNSGHVLQKHDLF